MGAQDPGDRRRIGGSGQQHAQQVDRALHGIPVRKGHPHCNVLPVIRRYLVGATLARTGDELSGPALLLLGLTDGPHAGSALLAGLTAAAAVGGPVFGALLDRSPAPGRLLAVALGGYAGGIALVTAVFGHLPLEAVVAVAVVTGLLNPAIAGGWTAQLPAVAGPSSAGQPPRRADVHRRRPGRSRARRARSAGPAGLAVAVGLVAAAVPVAWSAARAAATRRRPAPQGRLHGSRRATPR